MHAIRRVHSSENDTGKEGTVAVDIDAREPIVDESPFGDVISAEGYRELPRSIQLLDQAFRFFLLQLRDGEDLRNGYGARWVALNVTYFLTLVWQLVNVSTYEVPNVSRSFSTIFSLWSFVSLQIIHVQLVMLGRQNWFLKLMVHVGWHRSQHMVQVMNRIVAVGGLLVVVVAISFILSPVRLASGGTTSVDLAFNHLHLAWGFGAGLAVNIVLSMIQYFFFFALAGVPIALFAAVQPVLEDLGRLRDDVRAWTSVDTQAVEEVNERHTRLMGSVEEVNTLSGPFGVLLVMAMSIFISSLIDITDPQIKFDLAQFIFVPALCVAILALLLQPMTKMHTLSQRLSESVALWSAKRKGCEAQAGIQAQALAEGIRLRATGFRVFGVLLTAKLVQEMASLGVTAFLFLYSLRRGR